MYGRKALRPQYSSLYSRRQAGYVVGTPASRGFPQPKLSQPPWRLLYVGFDDPQPTHKLKPKSVFQKIQHIPFAEKVLNTGAK